MHVKYLFDILNNRKVVLNNTHLFTLITKSKHHIKKILVFKSFSLKTLYCGVKIFISQNELDFFYNFCVIIDYTIICII